jgi:SAM-dependent methyltransferase
MNVIEQIKEHYEKRKTESFKIWDKKTYIFSQYASFYREMLYYNILKKNFNDFDNLKLLEIGAGSGYNLYFFKKIGFCSNNIFANELLEDRLKLLRDNFPEIKIFEGDALLIDDNYNETFDIVFQSTVFSSITDLSFRIKLAEKIWNLLKYDGIILWYDFFISNPKNVYTKPITKKEVFALFPYAKYMKFYKTTLASPIARRVRLAYPFFNIFPFLRTHYVIEIKK